MKISGGALALLVSFFILMVLNPAYSRAGDIIAGGEWDADGQSFSYLGAGVDRDMSGPVSMTFRVFGGYLAYNFDSEGKMLDARVRMATPSLGIKLKKENYTLICSAGLDFRDTEKDTRSGGIEKDSRTGASVQAEAYVWDDARRSAGVIANFSTIDDFFWIRGRAKKAVYTFTNNRDLNIGAELIGMGNGDFSALQAGMVVELFSYDDNFSLLLKGGIKKASGLDRTGYGGIEIYYAF